MNSESNVADHCSVYALSDPTVPEFRQKCTHEHNEVCDHCNALDEALADEGKAVQETNFLSEEERDEKLYLFQTAKQAIQNWKGHQLRSVRQDQSRLDALERLDESTILVVNDWAMKFLPQLYRQSQQDWLGKRGISWHISVVFRKSQGKLQSQGFVHIVQSCSQDSTSVVLMMEHMLRTLESEHPEITKALYRQDNAGCYHCANTVLACASIEHSSGIKIEHLDFSDPQGGKGVADRFAATCKRHISIYINEGHNVGTAEEMKKALLSHGGVNGLRVAVVPFIGETAELHKIPGVSKMNNFQYKDGQLLAWRAYGVGKGKRLALGKDTGNLFKIKIAIYTLVSNFKYFMLIQPSTEKQWQSQQVIKKIQLISRAFIITTFSKR